MNTIRTFLMSFTLAAVFWLGSRLTGRAAELCLRDQPLARGLRAEGLAVTTNGAIYFLDPGDTSLIDGRLGVLDRSSEGLATPRTLLWELNRPLAVAAAGPLVYFTEGGNSTTNGVLWSFDPAHNARTLIRGGLHSPRSLFADSTGGIYVLEAAGAEGNNRLILFPPGSTSFQEVIPFLPSPTAVAVSPEGVIWISSYGDSADGSHAPQGRLLEYQPGSNNPVTLAENLPFVFGLAADASQNLYLAENDDSALGAAVGVSVLRRGARQTTELKLGVRALSLALDGQCRLYYGSGAYVPEVREFRICGSCAPTVDIVGPAEGAMFRRGQDVTLAALTSVPSEIAEVEFLVDSTPLGRVTAPPFQVVWASAVPGEYEFTARATDNQGNSTISAPRRILVAPPTPGELDVSFETKAVFGDCGSCLALDGVQQGLLVQPDDKILVAGHGLRRLHPDGRLDAQFDSGLQDPATSVLPLVRDMALLRDGRILFCGTFTKVHGVARAGIARLHPDGRLDETFDLGNGVPVGSVRSIAVQSNGHVLVAGTFTNIYGLPRSGIARLSADGRLDSDFTPGAVTPPVVSSVLVADNGSVFIAGNFASISGVPRPGFARLHPDGSLDRDFNPPGGSLGGGPLPPRVLAAQPDGRIWVTGRFGGPTNLARLRSNGSVDLGIAWPSASPYYPLSLALQPDGKVIVGGGRSPLARLKVDGSVDDTFVPVGFNPFGGQSGPQFIALQGSGRVVVAGDFKYVGTSGEYHAVSGFARLVGGEFPFFAPTIISSSLRHLVGGATSFRIKGGSGLEVITEVANRLETPDWTPIQTNAIGTTTIILTITDPNAAFFPQRFYRLVSP